MPIRNGRRCLALEMGTDTQIISCQAFLGYRPAPNFRAEVRGMGSQGVSLLENSCSAGSGSTLKSHPSCCFCFLPGTKKERASRPDTLWNAGCMHSRDSSVNRLRWTTRDHRGREGGNPEKKFELGHKEIFNSIFKHYLKRHSASNFIMHSQLPPPGR